MFTQRIHVGGENSMKTIFRDDAFYQVYKMNKSARGKALIVNVQFKGLRNDERTGTDVDRDNLKQLFEQLHLDVTIYNDEDGLTAMVGSWHLCIHFGGLIIVSI